ncbi:hypothetical protein PoB_006896500 [Plakobranchus ocellatus]|uniref:BESS domain-containing protein n=1 Tax=Plakobranchus ocellatus TaxID=259542 RepID=A0AAV4DEC6_9GAST|nr:hypothetical protein PoB_006896500 [Plakobranchus ocellatus]
MFSTKSGQGAEKKKKWNLFDAMSFLDPFVENPTTASNLESFESQADSRSLDAPRSSNVTQFAEQNEEDEQEEITTCMSLEQPHNFKRQPDNVQKTISTRRRKRQLYNPIDMEVLQALKEPEKEDDTDGYWWMGLKPMLKELDPIESLKFKHDITGLLLTFVERAKTEKAATRIEHTKTYPNTTDTMEIRDHRQPCKNHDVNVNGLEATL